MLLLFHNGHKKFRKPFKTQSRYMLLLQSAEKSVQQIAIGFDLTSDWIRELPGV